MFFEQYSHEPYIAVVRRMVHMDGVRPDPDRWSAATRRSA
jgi:hypothetical protein